VTLALTNFHKLAQVECQRFATTQAGEAAMTETIRAKRIGSPRSVLARLFVSSLLFFCIVNHVSSQAFTINKSGFQASAESFPGCKLDHSSSFLQKAINISKGELQVNVVQLDEKLYCIHLYDMRTSQAQSLIISGYDFVHIYMPDLMINGQIVPLIQFRTWLFFFITVAIRDEKLVLMR
jgi:hypothetical protein